jgi:hypothetical protein
MSNAKYAVAAYVFPITLKPSGERRNATGKSDQPNNIYFLILVLLIFGFVRISYIKMRYAIELTPKNPHIACPVYTEDNVPVTMTIAVIYYIRRGEFILSFVAISNARSVQLKI